MMNRISTLRQFNETYAYDSKGNRQSVETDNNAFIPTTGTYEYDQWNRLTKVTTEDNEVVEYVYNGDDLMVERKENGVITRYYYDGQQIIAEGIVGSELNVTPKASYLYGSQGLIMREDESNNNKAYYLANGHGDITEIRDASGGLLNSYTYDIWGNTLSKTGDLDNPFLYSGEYWDDTTNLQYLRARWYDPSMGRFINEDTYEGDISNPLSLNLYTYVHNNPLIYIDPTGHWNEKLGFNYVINEYKNMWEIATTKSERDHWAKQADDLRNQIRQSAYYKSGYYTEADIMQSTDAMIPMDEIMRRAHEMFPALSAIQGFTEGASLYIETHPGEAMAVTAGGLLFKGSKITKLEKGLNFAAEPAKHMANSGRFVPIQTMISTIKYGEEWADPRGSAAKMYYTVMYRNGKPYNFEVLYDKASNTVYHFEYFRDARGPLSKINK